MKIEKNSQPFWAFWLKNLLVRNCHWFLNFVPHINKEFKLLLDILIKNLDLRFNCLYADAELCAHTIDPCQWIYSPHIIIIFQTCCLATTTEASECVCTFINIYLISATKIRVSYFPRFFENIRLTFVSMDSFPMYHHHFIDLLSCYNLRSSRVHLFAPSVLQNCSIYGLFCKITRWSWEKEYQRK